MIIYEEILKAFQKEKVKYVIVGGIAFNLLGGYRSTLDMDVLVELSDSNLRKIIKILKKNGYRVKQPVHSMGLADSVTRRDLIKNKNMKAFNFYKGERDYREVDIIIDSPVTFEKAYKDSTNVKIGSMNLRVISISGLIKMKKRSGRNIDVEDIKVLNFLRKAR